MRSLRTSLSLALLFLVSLSVAAQKPAVTLESILGAPFPSEILASPAGGRLTWIQNDRGVRNRQGEIPNPTSAEQVIWRVSVEGGLDEVHSFLRHASWLEAYRAAADFFDRKLRHGR